MSFVLDNSIAMAWCFDDEVTPLTEKLLNDVKNSGAIVPELWPMEATNVLLIAERKKRIVSLKRRELINFLQMLPISIDRMTHEVAWADISDLAAEHRLTIYDAAYLELALRRELPLATLGHDLRRAAKKEKVQLLGK
jgi:predicted nucleic acid-binding protein